jgi:hypothetical protein
MLPDISIRINNLIKAVEQTIAPAIDPGNALAKEQAALVVSHLKMFDQQWDTAYLYETGSLNNMRNLASQLADIVSDEASLKELVDQIRQAVNALPSELPKTVSEVNQHTISLGKLVDALIEGCYGCGSGKTEPLMQAVLDYNHCQSSRERVWFRANNLDPDPNDLATMQEMLFSDIYAYKPVPPR